LAWKAATRIDVGIASLANALLTVCLEMDEDNGLLMAGKAELSFVEKVRCDAAARQVCFNIVGRIIEAISNYFN
jgi:hypothetical protein